MLNDAIDYYQSTPRIMFIPGLAIFITVLAFNLFGDGLRDAFDPKAHLIPEFPRRRTAGGPGGLTPAATCEISKIRCTDTVSIPHVVGCRADQGGPPRK